MHSFKQVIQFCFTNSRLLVEVFIMIKISSAHYRGAFPGKNKYRALIPGVK